MIYSYAYDLNVLFLSFFTALNCTSVAGSDSEICLHKVWNYKKCYQEMTFKHLVLVKPQHSVIFHATEYPVSLMIICINFGSSFTTCHFTGLAERPPEVSKIILNRHKLIVWTCDDLKD